MLTNVLEKSMEFFDFARKDVYPNAKDRHVDAHLTPLGTKAGSFSRSFPDNERSWPMAATSLHKEGKATGSATRQFDHVFECLRCDVHTVLAHLNNVPDGILHWPLPFFQGTSLFTQIIRLMEESEFRIRAVVVGRNMTYHSMPNGSSTLGLSDLISRYKHWSRAMHQMLGKLPDSVLDLFVTLPPSCWDRFGSRWTTVRNYLLDTLEQSILQARHIQFVCQLLIDSEGIFPQSSCAAR